jgi:hypothetical protein
MTIAFDRSRLGALLLNEDFAYQIAWGKRWNAHYPFGGTTRNAYTLAQDDNSLSGVDPNQPIGDYIAVKAGRCTLITRKTPAPNRWGLPYTSAMLCSVESYGLGAAGLYVEASIQAEISPGFHAGGLWLIGRDPKTGLTHGEVDVMEALGGPAATGPAPDKAPWGLDVVNMAVHCGAGDSQSVDLCHRGPDMSKAPHVYAASLQTSGITFYHDGLPVGSAPWPADFNGLSWRLVVTLDVGGDWAGPVPAGAPTQGALLIDYIRAYALK